MLGSPVTIGEAMSALKEDYQPKRVTFADLPKDPAPLKHSLSLNATPFFPKNRSPLYSQTNTSMPPLYRPQTPSQISDTSLLESQLTGVRRELSEKCRQLRDMAEEMETLRTENRNLKDSIQSADVEREAAVTAREEKTRGLEEAEANALVATQRAVVAEKKILSFLRVRSMDVITTEIVELERLVRWTELNPNTAPHGHQLRTHTDSVRELLQRVNEQYQSQFAQLDRGIPLSRLARVCSDIPARPVPVADPNLYLPTNVEFSLPAIHSPDLSPAGYAQPRYGPQTLSRKLSPPSGEDVHTRLINKLSSWHPELTDAQLYGYIIQAQKAAAGQTFSGMTLTEIITSVHELIINCRN